MGGFFGRGVLFGSLSFTCTITNVSPPKGSNVGGNSVIITGTGFVGVTGVFFGYVGAATFTVINATTIKVTVPPHSPGAIDIRVVTLTGESPVTPADIYTFVFTPSTIALPAQTWTFLIGDLVENTITAELPLNSVSFTSVLNAAGTFSGTLNLSDPRVQSSGAVDELIPGRTSIWVDLDGVLVWGGILYTTSYNNVTRILTIGGQDFWSYFNTNRRWAFDINPTNTTPDVLGISISQPIDPLILTRNIFTILEGFYLGGNIGVVVPLVTSGQSVTNLTVQGSQYLQVGQMIQQLAQQAGVFGFDYMIDVAWNGTIPTKFLTLSYPRRGQTINLNSAVFDTGALSCVGYTWPIDSSTQANTVHGVGSGSGTAVLVSNQTDAASVSEGWPMLEDSYSRTDINTQSTLDGVTTSYLDAVSGPVTLPTVTTTAQDPLFGSYEVGDDTRIIIEPDEYFSAGLDATWRVTSWQVDVNDQGVTTVQNTFALPPVAP